MFNTDKFRIKTVKRQTLAIILILIAGGTSTAFAVTNGSIITGDLTVTGTCTGCGGSESSYSNYNTIALNTTLSMFETGFKTIQIGNDGGVISNGRSHNIFVALNGTEKLNAAGTNAAGFVTEVSESESGKYKILFDSAGAGSVSVFKDSTLLQTLGIDTTQFNTFTAAGTQGIAISPNGKYIAVIGVDQGTGNNRLIIFQGAP